MTQILRYCERILNPAVRAYALQYADYRMGLKDEPDFNTNLVSVKDAQRVQDRIDTLCEEEDVAK